MTVKLRDEIKQTRPFTGPQEEAYLSVERTAAVLGHALAEALKADAITPTQYNVLRILRGAGEAGLCRNEIRDRLIAQVPDVTRLLDRMESAGLVERERGVQDRRFVTTRISAEGVRLLAKLDEPVRELHSHLLRQLSAAELKTLIRLLAKARGGV
jgi:DNA-binding MarR family transcriptional regulator